MSIHIPGDPWPGPRGASARAAPRTGESACTFARGPKGAEDG